MRNCKTKEINICFLVVLLALVMLTSFVETSIFNGYIVLGFRPTPSSNATNATVNTQTTKDSMSNEYQFVKMLGTKGKDHGKVSRPNGIAISPFGNIVVADTGNNRIQRFDSNGSWIPTSLFDPSHWFQNGQSKFLTGVAVNSFGDTYVVDKNDNHIHYFTQDLRSMHFSKWNNLTFTEPSGVAIDTLNNVYITSSKNTINEFTGDGHPIEDGLSVHNLTSPNGVAVDSLGNVYVSDTGKNRVQKFSPDGGSNYTAKSWGSLGSNAGQFNSPKGIAVDPSGYVYVADTGNNRVQKFDNNGTFITKWGSPGPRNGQFAQPFGIAVDPSGHVYVADTGNSRIQVFAPSNNTTN